MSATPSIAELLADPGRPGAPEPTLLPWLARWVDAVDLPAVAAVAAAVSRSESGRAWPAVADAAAAVLAARITDLAPGPAAPSMVLATLPPLAGYLDPLEVRTLGDGVGDPYIDRYLAHVADGLPPLVDLPTLALLPSTREGEPTELADLELVYLLPYVGAEVVERGRPRIMAAVRTALGGTQPWYAAAVLARAAPYLCDDGRREARANLATLPAIWAEHVGRLLAGPVPAWTSVLDEMAAAHPLLAAAELLAQDVDLDALGPALREVLERLADRHGRTATGGLRPWDPSGEDDGEPLGDGGLPEGEDSIEGARAPRAKSVELGGLAPDDAAGQRTVYALLDGPDRVDPGSEFELRVGLASTATAGVQQDAPFTVPPHPFTLSLYLVAPGFRLLGGQRARLELEVTEEDPHPYTMVRLRPLDGFADDRTILVLYQIGDHPLGWATRVVRVSRDAGAVRDDSPGGVWPLPHDDQLPPDLTITVAAGNDRSGTDLLWVCWSPHPDVRCPREPIPAQMNRSAEGMREAMRGIEDRQDSDSVDLRAYINGIGDYIAESIPAEVWAVLRGIAKRMSRPPTVLLTSADPYVPWELAAVPDPWDDQAPPILGAQAVVGRWTYHGQRTPGPPSTLDLDTMVVVAAEYADEDERLREAEQEAAWIVDRYAAECVAARLDTVIGCLTRTAEADVLHVALHGGGGLEGEGEGLMMSDGGYLSPVSVAGLREELGGRPSPVRLAFLNACQVGQGREFLGGHAGMALALIRLGVGAVMAPLWQVDDGVAREVAESFYPAVLGCDGSPTGVSPADWLRGERIEAARRSGAAGASRQAYLYFGHPRLRVRWRGERGADA